MTPDEQAAQLEEMMDNLRRTMDSVNAGMSNMATGMTKVAKAMGVEDSELKKLSESLRRTGEAAEDETEAEKALTRAKEIAKARQDAYNQALKDGQAAMGSFAGAVLDNNVKLTNYSQAVSKAGDAAFEFGKSLGPLGAIIGAVVKGATMLAEAQLKQTENLLNAKDELNKFGGAGAHTTESIRKMAREADLNSETLGRMIKPMKEMGSSIMVLGNNAGAAQKEFGKLIQATADERAQFQRLGISQEEMIKGTADYLQLQGMSGRFTKSELQDREKLRKASQDYQLNLMDLAALTGKDVAQLKEKQKEMALDNQLMIDNLQKNRKAAKLEEEAKAAELAGNKERAAELNKQAQQLKDEVKNRGAILDNLADAPEALKKGIKEIMATGSLSGENARVLAKMGMTGEAERLAKAIKSGAMTSEQAALEAAKAKDKYNQQYGNMIDTMGDSLKHSDELRKNMSVNTESLSNAIENSGRNIEKETKEQQQRRKDAQKPGQDRASDAQALAQEATIQATGKMDDLVAATNPLIGEFGLLKAASVALTAAAGAAAIALGVLGAKNALGGLLGKVGGAAGASGATGAAGAGLRGALGTAGKVVGKLAAPLAVGVAAYQGYSDYQEAKRKEKAGEISAEEAKKEKGKAVGGATGQAAGGVAGAVIGQMLIPIPGVGAAIGGMVGSWLGGKAGGWLGGKAAGATTTTPAGQQPPGQPSTPATPEQKPPATAPAEDKKPPATTPPSDKKTPKPEDKAKQVETKTATETMNDSLASVSRQLGLNTGALGQNTSALRQTNEHLKKYNDFATSQMEALDPDALAESLEDSVGGIGSTIKTAMSSALGSLGSTTGAAVGGAAPKPQMQKVSMGGGGQGQPFSEAEIEKLEKILDMAEKSGNKSAVSMIRTKISNMKSQNAMASKNAGADKEKLITGLDYDSLKDYVTKQGKQTQEPTITKMTMAQVRAAIGGGGISSAVPPGTIPSVGQIPRIPEPQLGNVIPSTGSMMKTSAGGSMPTIPPEKKADVKAPPRQAEPAGGGQSKAIASALPTTSAADSGSKTPAGPKPDPSQLTAAAGKPAAGSPEPSGEQAKGPPGGKFKDKEEFVKIMMPWAEYASKQLGAPALGILGQWAGESGAGKNLPADFNYAGIKAGSKFQKGDYVLTEERYNQKQLDRAMKSGESLAGVIDDPNDTIKKKGRDVTIDQWYGSGAYQKAVNDGLNWVQVKSYFAKFNDLKDFTDSYVGFLKNPRYAEALKAGSAEEFGYAVAKAGYATASADKYASKVGSFAKSISAAKGGLVSGPKTGFPATLHGNEIIVPLDPNSILADLGKKSKQEVQSDMKTVTSARQETRDDTGKELVAVNTQMMEMLASKLDTMINKLDTSNNTQSKLLKYSQA